MLPTLPDGTPFPRISIVTPSFNQGKFLEETIRSVLLQGYPNLEYIVMDGGSADNSVAIIRKYQEHLSYWVSEKDKGQADAIYRGFEKSTGEILGWVNSDDFLMPGALENFAATFISNRDTELLIGGCLIVDENGKTVKGKRGMPRFNLGSKATFQSLLWRGLDFNQPATLWRRDAFLDVDGFDRSMHFCFDYDLFLRLTRRKPAQRIRSIVAAYRLHPQSKTMQDMEIGITENHILYKKFGRTTMPQWKQALYKFIYTQKTLLDWRFDMVMYLLRPSNYPSVKLRA